MWTDSARGWEEKPPYETVDFLFYLEVFFLTFFFFASALLQTRRKAVGKRAQ